MLGTTVVSASRTPAQASARAAAGPAVPGPPELSGRLPEDSTGEWSHRMIRRDPHRPATPLPDGASMGGTR